MSKLEFNESVAADIAAAIAEQVKSVRTEFEQANNALRAELDAVRGECALIRKQAAAGDDVLATSAREHSDALDTVLGTMQKQLGDLVDQGVKQAEEIKRELGAQVTREVKATVDLSMLEQRAAQHELRERGFEIQQTHSEAVRALMERAATVRDGDKGDPGGKGDKGDQGDKGELPMIEVHKAGTLYERGTVVQHDGRVWQARSTTDSTPQPSDRWLLVMASHKWRGMFEPTADYLPNDVVRSGSGATWIAEDWIKAGGDCPGEGWSLYQKQGKAGKPGDPGPKGDRGDPGPAPRLVAFVVEGANARLVWDDGNIVSVEGWPTKEEL